MGGGEIGLPEVSTGLKFATSPQRQTNQQETVLSEAYNVRGDEENHGGEVAVAINHSPPIWLRCWLYLILTHLQLN